MSREKIARPCQSGAKGPIDHTLGHKIARDIEEGKRDGRKKKQRGSCSLRADSLTHRRSSLLGGAEGTATASPQTRF